MKIKIEGFKIERLLNKALEANIRVYMLVYISELEVECYIANKDIKRFQSIANPLYRVTVIKNVGKGYIAKSIRKNPLKMLFTAAIIFLVIFQTFFVKEIQVRGYKGIPESELISCLYDAGIREGSFIPNIDWKEAESMIYDTFPEVTWIQLVYDGQKVYLNISEATDNEKKQTSDAEEKYYCNIIATESGYVEKINTYRGVPLVEDGDYVHKGQALIIGCVPIKEKYHRENAPTEYYVKSKGEIWANVPYRLNFKQNLYDEKGSVKNKSQIIKKANQQIREWAQENLPEKAEILNKDLNFSYKENIIEVGVTIEIRQQIGEEQEILIGQKNTDSSRN
ncbi:MAG: sporulation protein YqfD [Firmicutes bacterium]|nr:sporulation protein YqfD [Bacillota bacterium]